MAIERSPRDHSALAIHVAHRFVTGDFNVSNSNSNSKSQGLCRSYQMLMVRGVTLSRDPGDGQVALRGPTTSETDPCHQFAPRCPASAAVSPW